MHMLNIGSCGIDCGECAAYKATQAGDMDKLKNVPDCTVYQCAHEKGVRVCSQCGDYSCGKLEALWKGYSLDVDQMKGNLAKAR